METVYIGLGSNLGDSLQVVLEGWVELGTIPGISLKKLSHPYRTEPVDMVSDNWFVNAAGQIETTIPPHQLMECLHRIEEKFGRRRDPFATDHQDRSLDFDLLLYGQKVFDDHGLIVPHPFLQDRLFVLQPLCEIADSVLHPILKKSMGELLAILRKSGEKSLVQRENWPQTKRKKQKV